MTHPITMNIKLIVDDLQSLKDVVQRRLDSASPEALEEWNRVRALIPSSADLDRGWVDLSETALEELRSKICRFAEILRGLKQDRVQVETDVAGSTVWGRRPP